MVWAFRSWKSSFCKVSKTLESPSLSCKTLLPIGLHIGRNFCRTIAVGWSWFQRIEMTYAIQYSLSMPFIFAHCIVPLPITNVPSSISVLPPYRRLSTRIDSRYVGMFRSVYIFLLTSARWGPKPPTMTRYYNPIGCGGNNTCPVSFGDIFKEPFSTLKMAF